MNPGPSPVNNRLAGSAVNRTGWVIYQRDPNPTYVGVPGVGESAVGWAFRMYRGSGSGSSDVITQLPYDVGGAFHFFGSLTLSLERPRRVAGGCAGIEETSARCAEVFPKPGGPHRQPGTKIGLSA